MSKAPLLVFSAFESIWISGCPILRFRKLSGYDMLVYESV
jgi:hypothetical protein